MSTARRLRALGSINLFAGGSRTARPPQRLQTYDIKLGPLCFPELVKLADPSGMPTNCVDLAWVGPGGDLLVVAFNNSPYLKVFTRNGDVLENPLTIPSAPTAAVTTCDATADGSVIGVSWLANNPDDRLRFWTVSGSTLTHVTDPTDVNFTDTERIRFTPSGGHLGVIRSSGISSSQLSCFTHSAGVIANRSNLSISLGTSGAAARLAWSPDGTLILCCWQNTAAVRLAKRTVNTIALQTNPTGHAQTTTSHGPAWFDNTYAMVAGTASIAVYQRSGDTLPSKVDNAFADLGARGPAVHPSLGTLQIPVTTPTPDELQTLSRSGQTLTEGQASCNALYEHGAVQAARWTADGRYLAIAGVGGIDWYKARGV